VAFDLKLLLAPDYDPERPPEQRSIPEDPLLTSGDYDRYRAQHP